jgi:hypothetical protein
MAGALRFDPRLSAAVIESRGETGVHNGAAFESSHDANYARVPVMYRHEIGDGDDGVPWLGVNRLYDQGAGEIAAPHRGDLDRREGPDAVFLRPEKPGEARFRIEIGQAQPGECAALADQRGGMQVTDQGEVTYL